LPINEARYYAGYGQKGDYPMKNRNFLTVATGVVVCIIVIWLSKSIQGGEKTYEIQPHITMPGYRADAVHAIDAYERLMDRYMGLTERNLDRIETNQGAVLRRLDSIDRKLDELTTKISRIERAIGAGSAKPAVKKIRLPESPDKKVHKD
jgi:hypothetical protein